MDILRYFRVFWIHLGIFGYFKIFGFFGYISVSLDIFMYFGVLLGSVGKLREF